MTSEDHKLAVVQALESDSPEVAEAAAKLAARPRVRRRWFRRFWSWLTGLGRRRPEWVDTGMGRLPWDVYQRELEFARASGNLPMTKMLERR